MFEIILIGDELGIPALEETLKAYPMIKIKGIIFNEDRLKAKIIANETAKRLKCKSIPQPASNSAKYNNFLKQIIDLKPYMGICYSYDKLLKKDLLDIFEKGVFNLHGALLPKYRGGNVLNWVLINGESKTGMTIHKMYETVDTGPIAFQKEVIIGERDTALTLREKLNDVALELLKVFFNSLIEGTLQVKEQDESNATYFKRRTPEDGYFTWNQDARSIYNLIRALVAPWPGAWYIKDGEKNVIDYFMEYNEVVELKKKMQE